jgi:AsmA-like protein
MKKKRTKKKIVMIFLGFILGVFLVLSVLAYNYLSSEHFCRNFVFPKIAKSFDLNVNAKKIEIKPFSRIRIKGLSVKDIGKEDNVSLVEIEEFYLSYDLLSFIGKKPHVHAIRVKNPQLNLVISGDGSTNAGNLYTGKKLVKKEKVSKERKSSEGKKKSSESFTIPDFILELLTVKNGELNFIEKNANGKIIRKASIRKIDLEISDFQPGKKSVMNLFLNCSMRDDENKTRIESSDLNITNKMFFAKDFSKINFNSEFLMNNFKGIFHGNNVEDYDLGINISMNQDKGILKLDPFSLVLKQKGRPAISAHASGEYSTGSGEGKFNLKVDKINSNLLNLIGGRSGNITFRDTAISYNADLSITDHGRKTEVGGKVSVDRFSVIAPEISQKPTEELDFKLEHKVVYDSEKNVIIIPQMLIKAMQKNREVISGDLDKVLTINIDAISEDTSKTPPIEYKLSFNSFDLAPFFLLAPLPDGTIIKKAELDSAVRISFRDNGGEIGVSGGATLKGLSGKIKDNKIPSTDFKLDFDAGIKEFSKVLISDISFSMIASGKKKIHGSINGNIDLEKGKGKIILADIDINVAGLMEYISIDGVDIESGRIEVPDTTLSVENQFRHFNISGKVGMDDFSWIYKGGSPKYKNEFNATFIYDASCDLGKSMINIKKAVVDLFPEGKSSGKISLSGDLDYLKGEGAIELKVENFSEGAIAPILGSMRKDWDLASLDLRSRQLIKISDGWKININGETVLKNTILKDRKEGLSFIPPITANLKNRITCKGSSIYLEDITLLANLEGHSTEKVLLTGRVILDGGMIKADRILIKSDFLSFDRYMPPFLFQEEKNEKKSEGKSGRKRGSLKSGESLEAMDLDFFNLNGKIEITKALFREIEIINIKGPVKMNRSRLEFPGFPMKVSNGDCDISGAVNFNVPGWEYEFKTRTEGLNLKPVVNSFVPDYRDQVTGTANLNINISGRGTEMHDLEKYLKGRITGSLKNGKFSGFPILTSLAGKMKIKELEELRFFRSDVDLQIAKGKININKLEFLGKYEKMGFRGWIGLDDSIDLMIHLALAPPLNKKIKKIKYIGEFLEDSDGYTEIPVPVGMKGTFTHPRPTIKIDESLEKTGMSILKGLLDREKKKRDRKRNK